VNVFLIDETFPPAAARLLRETYDHDTVHGFENGARVRDRPAGRR
jgi:hypothetical protein